MDPFMLAAIEEAETGLSEGGVRVAPVGTWLPCPTAYQGKRNPANPAATQGGRLR